MGIVRWRKFYQSLLLGAQNLLQKLEDFPLAPHTISEPTSSDPTHTILVGKLDLELTAPKRSKPKYSASGESLLCIPLSYIENPQFWGS